MEPASAEYELYEIAYFTTNNNIEGIRAEFWNLDPLTTYKAFGMFRSSVNLYFELITCREDYHRRLTVFFT